MMCAPLCRVRPNRFGKLVVRAVFVVAHILHALGLDYSTALFVDEPPGQLRAVTFVVKQGPKPVKIVTLTIDRDAVAYSDQRIWERAQVLKAPVRAVKVVEVAADKFKP